ncbi:putative integral membrane protein [Geomicrobium halophilum]|uniref:Putative integral membrane protein n=1 Tax=Geomicrobium halophilum TaxID=549000 RepID=A0A841PYN5_9BACL|nr:lipopolysaccharide assembly protein LapA domain-containing protein [Geomicrobium halophilum]MBB6449502.1 putative integral membrane protein [Geomicrobium halophilum]
MKGQWMLILGLIAALLISIFAVINVDSVTVNFLFGTTQIPLILVILGSVLAGGLVIGGVGMLKVYRLQQEIRRLKKNNVEGRQLNDHPDPQAEEEGSEARRK